MMRIVLLCAVVSIVASCGGGGTTPASPTAPTASTTAAAKILLAGQSNAFFFLPYLPEALDYTNIDASINAYLGNRDLAERARTTPLLAFVWWGGSADVGMSVAEYAEKLRALIGIARTANPALPVRIIEIPDFPIRANVREAQRQVAADSGNQFIPTADLPWADAAGHLTDAGFRIVRDRLNQSLGR